MQHFELFTCPYDPDLWMKTMVRPEKGFDYYAYLLICVDRTGSGVSKQLWEKEGLDMLGICTAGWGEEQTKGGVGDGLLFWDDNVANVILGTEPNDNLAYAPGLELHHPIVSMIGGHGEPLEIDRER